MAFVGSVDNEIHGNPPVGPLIIPLNGSGFAVGDMLLLHLVQAAIGGAVDTVTFTPSWGAPIDSDNLAIAVTWQCFREAYAGEAQVSIALNGDGGSLPL